jgi:Ankyrin repeats (3 copies)
MTQATPTPPSPIAPDELVARYQAAQAALDSDASTAVQPSPAVRANVLAYAQQLADARMAGAPGLSASTTTSTSAPKPPDVHTINAIATQAVNTWTTGSFEHKKPASNDSQWKIKALASAAIFGLSSLLFVQWQDATPDEQNAAFSVQRPAPAAPAPQAAQTPSPAVATAPAPAVRSESAAAPVAAADKNSAPAPETRALDKEFANTQAAAPATESAAKASSAKPMREPTAELAAGNATQAESAPNAPASMAPPAPVSAPAPAPAPAAAPAQARSRATARDATLEPNPDNMSAPRGKPSGSFAAKETNSVAINPAGSSTADQLAAGASGAAASQPFPRQAPLVAVASVNSALFNAIRNKNRNALQAALDNGADKNAKDNGTSAITLCVQAGQTELVRLLAAAGADVNALDAQGISALEHARGRGLQDIIAVLMQYGAK